jgi:hypothetical protein
MSAADFLLAPEVQKLLVLVFSRPTSTLTANEMAKASKLTVEEVQRTQDHLIRCGILTQCRAHASEQEAVRANTTFVFYNELRSIALKSFAAAEPIRAMLRSKFKRSVLRAYVLGEDQQGTVELLVVHGLEVPDEQDMAAACKKLSVAIGRELKVHVISARKYAGLTERDAIGMKMAAASVVEVIAEGETQAKPAPGRGEGLIDSALKKIWPR